MGAPIKHRKKFISHKKRWDKATIEDEGVLVSDYALKNKKEIRKVERELSTYKKIAKSLNSTADTKESQQAQNFIEKLKAKGYLDPSAKSLDEVLDITIRNLLERRLSNILYRNKLARTPAQARQFIVHGHVLVGDKCVTSPSFSVTLAQEAEVGFVINSTIASEQHPERILAAGGMIEVEEMEKIPLKKDEESFDEKEAELDDQEQDEVNE